MESYIYFLKCEDYEGFVAHLRCDFNSSDDIDELRCLLSYKDYYHLKIICESYKYNLKCIYEGELRYLICNYFETTKYDHDNTSLSYFSRYFYCCPHKEPYRYFNIMGISRYDIASFIIFDPRCRQRIFICGCIINAFDFHKAIQVIDSNDSKNYIDIRRLCYKHCISYRRVIKQDLLLRLYE